MPNILFKTNTLFRNCSELAIFCVVESYLKASDSIITIYLSTYLSNDINLINNFIEP